MEDLEDDTRYLFQDGTLEMRQEAFKTSRENSLDKLDDKAINEEVQDKSKIKLWNGINPLINLPKKLRDTIWGRNKEIKPSSDALTQVSVPIAVDDPCDFFIFKHEMIEKAMDACVEDLIDTEIDGEILGTYILTEISLWDAEKERMVILATWSLYIVKYDFIALRKLDHKRVDLLSLDRIELGRLVYPAVSLVPKLNGLANGVSEVVKGTIFQRNVPNLAAFQARDRNCHGLRLTWDKGVSLRFTQMWNPFNSEVPFATFTSHPLLSCADQLEKSYRQKLDVDELMQNLTQALGKINESVCHIAYKDIVLQSYVGLGSLIHNRNSLGFFKIRGRVSF